MRHTHHNIASNFALAWNSWTILVDKILPIDSSESFRETRKNSEKSFKNFPYETQKCIQSSKLAAWTCRCKVHTAHSNCCDKSSGKFSRNNGRVLFCLACAFLPLRNALHAIKANFLRSGNGFNIHTTTNRIDSLSFLWIIIFPLRNFLGSTLMPSSSFMTLISCDSIVSCLKLMPTAYISTWHSWRIQFFFFFS